MSEVRTEITLVNIVDQGATERGYIPQDQVRRLTVNAVVDTGAWPLVINGETREKLELKIEEPGETAVAGGGTIPSGITEYVEVCWKDRRTACEAVVIPGEEDVLMGAFPLEGLDLMIHPGTEEVVGAHGDKIRNVVKRVRKKQTPGVSVTFLQREANADGVRHLFTTFMMLRLTLFCLRVKIMKISVAAYLHSCILCYTIGECDSALAWGGERLFL